MPSHRAEAIGWAAFLVFVVAVFRLRRALDAR
jgi:hypothetical protein